MRGLSSLVTGCLLWLVASGSEAADWPSGLSFHAGTRAEASEPRSGYRLMFDGVGQAYFVAEAPFIAGADIVCLAQGRDWTGSTALFGQFSAVAARRFSEFTRDHVGEPFFILFNGELVSAPVITSRIPGPQFNVSGGLQHEYEKWLKASGLKPCKPLTAAERAAENMAFRDVLIGELGDPRSDAYDQLTSMVQARVIPQPSDGELADWLQTAVEAGSPSAMVSLAMAYEFGRNVAPDLDLARVWWRRAAEAGDPIAILQLAWLYADGRGVAPDAAQADHWFGQLDPELHDRAFLESFASQGQLPAMVTLGILLAYDPRKGHDLAAAAHWLRKAADKGDATAMYALGRLLASSDRAQAQRWLRKASRLNYHPAVVALRDLEAS